MNAAPAQFLSELLDARHAEIASQLLDFVQSAPDLPGLKGMIARPEAREVFETLLQLLARYAADPTDDRAFNYARQRAHERFRTRVPLLEILRLTGALRQMLIEMTGDALSNNAESLRETMPRIAALMTELDATFTDTYQRARDLQWRASETKYFSLFENASEAILSFRPGEGAVIEANAQAEKLTGRTRDQLIGVQLSDLFALESQEAARWLVSQSGQGGHLRLEEATVTRADGTATPVSLSCNWLQVDGERIAQAILRDVTVLRRMQRELQSYAEGLEERVRERTHALQESEERFRTLFLQEQRRARHLSLINDVQQAALLQREADAFLHGATVAIAHHFRPSDVAITLRDGARDALMDAPGGERPAHEFVVVSEEGGNGFLPPPGATLPATWPLLAGAQTARHAQRDTSATALLRPQNVHRDARSEIIAPILLDNTVAGTIWARSDDADAFEEGDCHALETVAAIVSASLANSRMFADLRELAEFNQTLISTMLHSLTVFDREGRVKIVNDRLCVTLHKSREELIGRSLEEVFGLEVVERHGLRQALQDVTEHGAAREEQEVHVRTPEATLTFDLRFSRVYFRGEAQCVILLINLTLRWRKAHQLQLMNEVGRLFQASLDVNRVLFSVLTCITAGSALGFNRAFLLLRDEEHEGRDGGDGELLRGATALGPSSPEEASNIWHEMSRREPPLSELLARAPNLDPNARTPLQLRTMSLRLDLQNPGFAPFARAVSERRAVRVSREEWEAACVSTPVHAATSSSSTNAGADTSITANWRDECQRAMNLLTTQEIAVAPLVAKERVVGLVLADNLYSGAPIDSDDLQLLDTLAHQAGLTVDNALTYTALQKAQGELVGAERLVAVGEMAARVSHEIRNPLATIGGFARSILKRADDPEWVQRKTGIIVEEVARLEELLTDLLDMARARRLDLQPHNVNAIVEHALLLAQADIRAANVQVHLELQPLPIAVVDRARLLQALLNTIRNGAQAMPNGGTLTLRTSVFTREQREPSVCIEVCDTGVGMSDAARKRVFDPFFSTKISGSGLGLAVTRRIIEDHDGQIDVHSQEGEGTTFCFSLPLRTPDPALVAPE